MPLPDSITGFYRYQGNYYIVKDKSNHDHSHGNHFEGFNLEDIKENFSALAKELEDGGQPIGEVLNEVNTLDQSNEPGEDPVFRGYDPSVEDFLARASTVDECEEIISYCLQQGEITEEEADKLRYRLEKGGPRAFGTRKPGYYDQYF